MAGRDRSTIRRARWPCRAICIPLPSGVVHYAAVHYEKNGHLEWVHSETGVRTLKDEFDKVAWHNANHLKQIGMAMGRG